MNTSTQTATNAMESQPAHYASLPLIPAPGHTYTVYPVRQPAIGISVGVAPYTDHFEGYVKIEESGQYNFMSESDDSSTVTIENKGTCVKGGGQLRPSNILSCDFEPGYYWTTVDFENQIFEPVEENAVALKVCITGPGTELPVYGNYDSTTTEYDRFSPSPAIKLWGLHVDAGVPKKDEECDCGCGCDGVTGAAQAANESVSWTLPFGGMSSLAGIKRGKLSLKQQNITRFASTPAALAYSHISQRRLLRIDNATIAILSEKGSARTYSRQPGSADCLRSGYTRVYGSLVRTLDADRRPCIASPAYIEEVLADGTAIRYSVQSGDVVDITTPAGNTVTASQLAENLEIIRENQAIAQIRSKEDGLLDISILSDAGYRIAWYGPAAVGAKNSGTGRYAVTGEPEKTWTIQRPTAITPWKMLSIDEQIGSVHYLNVWQQQGNTLTLTSGEGDEAIITERTTAKTADDTWEELYTVKDLSGCIAVSEQTITRLTGQGPVIVSHTLGYGTPEALVTTMHPAANGRIAGITRPDGSALRFEYDAEGREILRAEPWAGGGESVTRTTYAALRYNDNRPATVTRSTLAADGTETVLHTTAYTYEDLAAEHRITISETALGSPHTRIGVTTYYNDTASLPVARGRVRYHRSIDGAEEHHTYLATGEHGAAYSHNRETRINSTLIPGWSESLVYYIDARGNTASINNHIYRDDSRWELLSQERYTSNAAHQWTERRRANGRVTVRTMACVGPLSETDEDGITTTHSYNSLKRHIETIRAATETTPETITGRTYDPAGRTLSTRIDAGPMATVTSQAYDMLGRIITQTDALGRITATAYSADLLSSTVTTPAGATFITRRHSDGAILEQSGTGRRHTCTAFALNAEGVRSSISALGETEDGTPVLLGCSTANGYGETILEEQPDTLGGTLATRHEYNAKAQRVRSRTADLAPTTWEYGETGRLTRQTVLLNPETPVDATANRITDYATRIVRREDGAYRETVTTDYSAEGSPITRIEATLITDTSATLAAKTIATDSRGNQTAQWTEYGAPTRRIRKTQRPGIAALAIEQQVDGYTLSSTDHAGLTTTGTRTWRTGGIVETRTDPRGNTSSVETDVSGRPVKTTDAAGNATTTAYDPATGQPSLITDPQGGTTCYRYDMRGRTIAQYGTAVQPIAWEYDAADRIAALTTWRIPGSDITTDPSGRTDGDTTLWSHHPATGLLLGKTYSDGTATRWTYDSLNRPATCTQARGTVSTYAYHPLTGQPAGVVHSDGTPGETYAYNHLGQPTVITDAAGSRTLAYNNYGEPETEQTAGLVASTLTYTRDTLGRSSGYRYHHGWDILKAALAYDAAGRLSTLTRDNEDTPYTWTYHSVSGLPQILQYRIQLKQWKTYEEKRNLLTKIDYLRPYSATYPAKNNYTYDTLGRPSTREEYWDTAAPERSHTYEYNGKSELTADTLANGATFGYGYDNIGNRTRAGDTSYTSTPLNQYGAVGTFAPVYDPDGNQTLIKTATGEWQISYNANNRPVEFVQGTKRITCLYDHIGRRIEKASYESGALVKRQRYAYMGYLQIAEIDALDETAPRVTRTYLWDPSEPVATRILSMCLYNADGSWKDTLYYTHDLQKNVTALFGGQVNRRAKYQYDAYGNLTLMEGDAAEENPYRYSSEYHDSDLGLIYYNYRHYNPTDGRWITRDPIAERGGANLYGFVGNRIGRKIDWLGLESYRKPFSPGSVDMDFDPLALQWRLDKLYERNPFVDSLKGVKMPKSKPDYGWTLTVKETAYFMNIPCRGKVMTKTCVFSSMVDSSKKDDENARAPFKNQFIIDANFGTSHGWSLSSQFTSTQTEDIDPIPWNQLGGAPKTHHSSVHCISSKCQYIYTKEISISYNAALTADAMESYACGSRLDYKNEDGLSAYISQEMDKTEGLFTNKTLLGIGWTEGMQNHLFGIPGFGISIDVGFNHEDKAIQYGVKCQYAFGDQGQYSVGAGCTRVGKADAVVGVEGNIKF